MEFVAHLISSKCFELFLLSRPAYNVDGFDTILLCKLNHLFKMVTRHLIIYILILHGVKDNLETMLRKSSLRPIYKKNWFFAILRASTSHFCIPMSKHVEYVH